MFEIYHMSKTALIIGATGQDGILLSRFLLDRGYAVHGTSRRDKSSDKVVFHKLNVTKSRIQLDKLLDEVKPDEIYNLAAQSSVSESWHDPKGTCQSAMWPLYILDSMLRKCPNSRFFQASSAAIFGNATETPQTESTLVNPCTPYGVGKLFGHQITKLYREHHGLYAVSGILYNHESQWRNSRFVSRKISKAVVRIKHGKQKVLKLGNLDACRDWGYAGDYVQAMWSMLQRTPPDDYIIASGETHTVREFLELAFDRVGLKWQDYVEVDQSLVRSESCVLHGDHSKISRSLGWQPTVTFDELVGMMVNYDMGAISI